MGALGKIEGETSFDDPFDQCRKVGTVRIYDDLIQGSDDWLQARLGILTASEMKLILTPTLKVAKNVKERQHLYELLAQRITKFVEPHYVGDDMMRGHEDEVDACLLYSEKCAPVSNAGFITNDKWGFTLGYSPDGLVGDNGLVECKSRRSKYQVQTILEHVVADQCRTIPEEYILQHQAGLLISEREWIDFISYSGGLPMAVIRVHPDDEIQSAIVEAASAFEGRLQDAMSKYDGAMCSDARLFPTERKTYEDISI